MTGEPKYQIGEVANRVGLSLRTLRYYEEVGVLEPSARTQGGFRLYTDRDVERLVLVKRLKPLEFSLDELRELLRVRDRLARSDLNADERSELADRLAAYAEAAEQRCVTLREQMTAVEQVTATLRWQARREQDVLRSSG
jgi:DNA-binding transcriptional MerR regulator